MAKTQAEVRAAKDAALAKYDNNKSSPTHQSSRSKMGQQTVSAASSRSNTASYSGSSGSTSNGKFTVTGPIQRYSSAPTESDKNQRKNDYFESKYGYKTRSFGKDTYDSEAFDSARDTFMDWMTNTGTKGGANNKKYGYDWSDPEDVARFNNRQVSKKYEASYSNDPLDQWLKANGQASADFFNSTYYRNAYSTVMSDRIEKQKARDFKNAVVREAWSTASDRMNITDEEMVSAYQRVLLNNPEYKDIEIYNPKDEDTDYSDYASPLLAEQTAKEEDEKNRVGKLDISEIRGDLEALQKQQTYYETRDEALAQKASAQKANQAQSIINDAISNNGFSVEIDKRVGLARDSKLNEYNNNKKKKQAASDSAIAAMREAGYSNQDIQKAIRQDGRLSYSESTEGKANEAERIARRDSSDATSAKILNGMDSFTQGAVDKAKKLGNMGTSAQQGFSPISMMEGYGMSAQETQAVNNYVDTTRAILETQGYNGLEIDNALRRADLGEYIPTATARTNYATYTLQECGLTDEQIQKVLATYTEEDWKNTDKDMLASDYVENSMADQLANSIISMPIRAALSIACGAVGLVDMGAAAISGRKELWKFTDDLQELSAWVTQFSHDRNHEIISTAADVGAEIMRMRATSLIGSALPPAATTTSGSAAGTNFLFNFMQKNASHLPFISGAIGNYYLEAVNGGATPRMAALYAIPAGALEGYLESLEMGEVLQHTFGMNIVGKKIAASGLSANFKQFAITKGMPFINFALGTIGEGLEEAASYYGSSIARMATWDKGYEMDFSEMWDNAKGGLLIGGIMNGLSMGAHTQSYKYASEIYKGTGGNYAAYLDSFMSAMHMENMNDVQRQALIDKYNSGEINVSRDAAINAGVEIQTNAEVVAAKKQAVESAENDAAVKVENANNKVTQAEQRLAGIDDPDPVKKGKKLAQAARELTAAKAAASQTASEGQKKVDTATADYKSEAAKAKRKNAANQQLVDEYHASKYCSDIEAETDIAVEAAITAEDVASLESLLQSEKDKLAAMPYQNSKAAIRRKDRIAKLENQIASAKSSLNAAVSPAAVDPAANTNVDANTAQNGIDTIKNGVAEVAEPVVAETVEVPTEMDFGADTVVAEQGVFNESRVSSNTLTKKFGEEAIKTFKDLNPDFGSYEVVSEETTMRNAENWINSDGIDKVEYKLLDDKRKWDGTDVDAAMMLLTQKMSDGAEGGVDALLIAEKMQEQGTEGGQLIQSFAKWSRTPAGMAVEAVKQTKKTQKKILDGNATTRKSVEADRKAAKEAKKKAVETAAAIATDNALEVVGSVFPDVAYSSNNSTGESAEASTFRRTKKRDPVELLSKRIVSATKPKSDQELDYVQRVVRDLFGVAKESPILRVDDTSTDQTYSNVGEAYSLKTDYQDIWNRTKQAVLDMIGDDVALNVALDNYFRTGERPIISQKAIDKAYNKAMGEIGADMRSIITKTADQQAEMRDALVDYVIQQTGVDEDGAVALAMEIVHTFNRERTKATANFLKSQLGNTKQTGRNVQSAIENINALINAGALVDATYSEAMMAKLDPKLRKAIKQSGYSIGDIISRGALAERQQFHQFMNEVVGMNLSDADLDTIATMAADTFRTVVAEDKQRYLDRQFSENKDRSFSDDSLTSVEKLVNAGLLTNEEIADKVADKLDSKFRKTVKELGINVRSVVEQGVDAVAEATANFAAQADGLNISDSDKQQIRNAMTDTFSELVAEVKDKYAQTLINKYEAKQNPTEKQPPMDSIQKVLYNATMGIYSDKRIDDAILEANGLPVVTEEDIAYIKANMEKALEARRVMNSEGKDALYEGERADYQIRRYQEEAAKVIASKMSVDGRVKFRDFQRLMMLLNPKTLIKNTAANVPMGVLENIKDNPAALVDILVSKITGKRTTQGTTLNKIKAQAEGLKKGVTETIKDYKYGVNTANANMLGRYSAFEDGDVINRTTNAKPRVWNNDTLVGKVLNGADKLLSTGMTLGDRPFFEAAAASRAAELEALGYDVNSDESQIDIVRYALDRTFQNNSDAAQAFSSIRNGLNKLHIGDVGFGDLVMPFVQTPGNITDKLIDYSGVGGAARGIAQIIGAKKTGEFDQKLFVDRMGRSMTGFGMMALGYALAKCGALVLGARDDEERQAMNNAGVKEFSITIDGETYHTIDWADPTANLLFIGGAIAEMGFEGATMGQIVEASTGTAVNSIFQMSVLQNLASVFSGSEDNVWRNLGGTAENFPTQFVWATINAVARTADPYERETYSPDRLQQMANKIMAKIPGLRERLPIKLNTAGQEVESYRGDTAVERFIQSFINPGYTTEATDDVVHSELWRLRKEGGFDSQYLPKAYKSFDGIQLTTEEYQEYQRILGNATYSAALKVIESAEYKKADDAEKADMLDKAISKAISSKEVKDFKNSLKD